MEQLLAAIFSLLISLGDSTSAKALLSTANDTHLTIETAAQHVAAARFAAEMTGTDPDLLLAIAWHESRYEQGVTGPPLSNGKHVCGVMQEIPIMGPCPKRGLIADYFAGASHLAVWIRAAGGSVERGMAGYAGGYPSLARYDEGGPSRIRALVQFNLARAKRIKAARELGARPVTRTHDVSPS